MDERVRLIKRYSNRKLYDSSQSAYVTLKELAEFIRTGEMIKVVDHDTGEDLTYEVLLQIIRHEGKRSRFISISDLANLIRSTATQSQEFLSSLRTEVDAKMPDISREFWDYMEKQFGATAEEWRGTLHEWEKSFESWQKDLEHTLEDLVRPIKSRLDELEKDIKDLQSKIDTLR